MPPALSIIIPVLNEAPQITPLLLMLARQQEIDFEVVISDGGSTDGTPALARNLPGTLPYPVRLVTFPRGRAIQMNRGAAAAAGEWLLFLHADSALPDPRALRSGLSLLTKTAPEDGQRRTAGHFTLRFDTAGREDRFGYRFCEGKARLGRPGGILGDQGLLLSRELFERVGPFDEGLPVAEDVEYAERLRTRGGGFLLLPAEIITSARRFETEGYRSRQTLNALIMGLLFSGRPDLLSALTGCYRSHHDGRTLELSPFFEEIARQISRLPSRERLYFWYRVGSYVRANAWQLAYLLDLRKAWQRGAMEEETPYLACYDRYLDRLTDHPPGRMLTAGAVWLWFTLARRWRWLREG